MENTRTSKKRQKKRKGKWFRVISLTMLVLLVGGGAYLYSIYSNVARAVNNMNHPIDREKSKKREEKVAFHKKDPISILLVGVDERKGDNGRTDSMLVVTVNPEKKSTKLLSIPRDTRTKLIDPDNPNKVKFDKINHAYAFGGIEESIETVEHFLNVPIDYYVKVNMEGFKDIVNAVGGIDVDNKFEFELDGVRLPEGQLHLNGEEALQYARMRKADPRGDWGRQERQREVIAKIIEKGKSFSTLANYDKILAALEKNVKTNLTLDDMIGIQNTYKPAAETIDKIEINGEGKMINSGWYFLVSDETRQQLSNDLRDHLGLPSDTIENLNMLKQSQNRNDDSESGSDQY